MAFNEELLKGIFENEETSVEDKIKLVMAEHEADVTGLKAKRDELLGKIKEKDAELAKEIEGSKGYAEKLASLEQELKSKNPEDLKKMLENQFAEKEKDWKKTVEELTAERDRLKDNDLKRIFNESLLEGTKDLNFMDGLKDGFIARVKTLYSFEPKEIEGVTQFYTADMKTPKDIVHEFALTQEGKAYIKAQWNGGGATGSGSSNGGTANTENPWKKGKSFNLTKQAEIMRRDPVLAERLKREANM